MDTFQMTSRNPVIFSIHRLYIYSCVIKHCILIHCHPQDNAITRVWLAGNRFHLASLNVLCFLEDRRVDKVTLALCAAEKRKTKMSPVHT